MPRIAADTVAQNRVYRVTALMRAGAALLADQGAFTVESVSAAVGISRSSFYEYFSSSEALARAIVTEEAAALAAELEPTGDGVAEPVARIHFWVRTRLAQANGRGQRLLDVADQPNDAEPLLTAPLMRALRELGPEDADRLRDYLVALVAVGMRRIVNGVATVEEETAAMMRILDPLLQP